MDAYNRLKQAFFCKIMTELPDMDATLTAKLGELLDKAAYDYDVRDKETAIIISADPIPMLLRIYIATKKTEGLSDLSLKNYAGVLTKFFQWCRKQPEEVTAIDIRMFLYTYSQERRISDRTLDKYRSFICWFFEWAYNEEYIERNPAKQIRAIKYEVKERQSLSQMELEYMRNACKDVRDRAILEFFYSTGCRVSELTGVKQSDINWDDGTVHLFGKGRKHRTSYLNAKAIVSLRAYLKTRTDDNPSLFVVSRAPYNSLRKEAVEYVIKRLSRDAGLGNKVTPHILRHTTATQAVNAGMPIEDVSKLLGHASINTTMVYAKPSAGKVQAGHLRCVV